ncbi:MAG: PilZ domain [Planctomycetota bacterium]
MDEPRTPAAKDHRREDRVPLDGQVTISIDAQQLPGPGRNVSAQGVYFTTSAKIRVQVQVPGQEAPIPGELVRVESMGDGSVGIAVRFLPSPAQQS